MGFLNFLDGESKKEDPDDKAVLKAITAQHGIPTERAHQLYACSHLTFQEYYTAKYLAYFADILGHALGKILIEDQHTFVDVPEQFVEKVLAKKGNFKMRKHAVTVELA